MTTLVARNADEVIVEPLMEFRGVCFAVLWSLESGVRFCAGAFGRNLASVAVKLFLNLTYSVWKFYDFFAVSVCSANMMLQ